MEEHTLDENQISPQTLDPTASQKKHAAMLERLSNLHQSRIQQSTSRRSDSTSSAAAAAPPAFESVQSFLERFSESKRFIESDVDRLRSQIGGSESESHRKSDLEKVSLAIADLEKLLAENSYFLPSYEVRTGLKAISDLKEAQEKANSELLPRKRFAFKNKSAKKDTGNLIKEAEETRVFDVVPVDKLNLALRHSQGFTNKENVVLVKKFMFSEEGGGDFSLSDLNSCKIYLKGRFRALFIHRLQNCQVFVGPVLGSILIEEVEGCLFMLASHQIRIHQARETDFYLRVRSRPIIEDSRDVRFAPYQLRYQGIEEELINSDLGDETGNWEKVDDFRWLRAVQSPNWCILAEEERVGTVTVPDLEDQGDYS